MLPYSQNACHCRRRVARGADIMRARSSRPLSPGVVEGPRFLPPDPTVELVRRNNAAARVRPESIFITGLSGVLAADTTWVLKEVLGSRASLAAAAARRFRIGTPTQRHRDSIRLGRSGVL